MTVFERLEVYGFNLKPIPHKLVQKALDLREQKKWRKLYRVLHKIKVLRQHQSR